MWVGPAFTHFEIIIGKGDSKVETFYSRRLKDGKRVCQGTEHSQELPMHSSYPLFCIICVCASCAPYYSVENQHLLQKTVTWESLLLSNCVVIRTPW